MAVAKAGGWDNPMGIVERRMRRQEAFASVATPYEVVIDAWAFLRWPCDDAVLATQASALLQVRPNVALRVIPAGGAADVVGVGSFTMYDFGEDEPSVAYTEGHLIDVYQSAPGDVEAHAELFSRLWNAALSFDATREYLEKTSNRASRTSAR